MIGPALPSVTVPYARDLADAVLRGAGDHGLSVLMTQTHGDVRRERGVRDDPYLRHVDGILLAPVARRPRRTRPPGRARPATVSPRWPPGGRPGRPRATCVARNTSRGCAMPVCRCARSGSSVPRGSPSRREPPPRGPCWGRPRTPTRSSPSATPSPPGPCGGCTTPGAWCRTTPPWPGSPTWPRRRSAPRPHHGRPRPRGTGRACRVAPRRTHPGAGGRRAPASRPSPHRRIPPRRTGAEWCPSAVSRRPVTEQ